jgi:hypothetical protein
LIAVSRARETEVLTQWRSALRSMPGHTGASSFAPTVVSRKISVDLFGKVAESIVECGEQLPAFRRTKMG